MKRFAIIGLGSFGAHVARTLYEYGKNVIAIDNNEERVQEASEFATQAIVADATERHTLDSLGIRDVDAAIISLGQRMDITTLAALHMKEMNVPFVAVKAISEEHGRILRALGVNEIIYPEKDIAIRLGNRLARTDVVDFLPLLPGYSITEIKTPPSFIGKTIGELALRNKLNVQIIAIQTGDTDAPRMNIVPRAEDKIREGDLLILLGEDQQLDRIREIV